MRITESCECPTCGSEKYRQVDDERKYEYPVMYCSYCDIEFWSE